MLEGAGQKPHQDHITAKGLNSVTHYRLVHKFIPRRQAMKIADARSSSGKRKGEKLGIIPARQLTKVRNKNVVNFASLMDLCHLKNSELELQYQKYKGRVALRGDIGKHDSGSYAVFTEQGSSASRMTAAKVIDILSRLPGCLGQAADAVSAYTHVKMEGASTF